MNWISVEDRKPKDGDRIIGWFDPDHVEGVIWYDDGYDSYAILMVDGEAPESNMKFWVALESPEGSKK